jgi:hypothetical protein
MSTARRVRYATEPVRAVPEGGALAAGLPLLRFAPRGEPHPVLVLPGSAVLFPVPDTPPGPAGPGGSGGAGTA